MPSPGSEWSRANERAALRANVGSTITQRVFLALGLAPTWSLASAASLASMAVGFTYAGVLLASRAREARGDRPEAPRA